MPKHEKLLEEITSRFTYCQTRWQSIRQEATIDMRYVSGNPWPPDERNDRIAAGRPIVVVDELNQYVNQLINSIRQNKRTGKVDPRGDGANDQTAALREDMIRQIEYRSNAQAVHCTAFSGAVERSYGYSRISKCYCDEGEFDQELRLEPIPNPDTVYFDPDFIQADASDISYAFIIDSVPRKEYEKRYPDASIVSFTPELAAQAPGWIKDDAIQVAEYWRVEMVKRTLLLVDHPEAGPTKVYLDEVQDEDPGAKLVKTAVARGEPAVTMLVSSDGSEMAVKQQRKTETRKVTKYITNGVEILEETPWDGKYIPIAACFGKEEYVDKGRGSERTFKSMIRLARDAAMAINYLATSEIEIIGQAAKSPYLGYTGQFENHENEFQTASKRPIPYLQAHAFTDEWPIGSGAPMPLPQKNAFNPEVQSIEIAKESFRRSLQSSMGISQLPTAAQRQSQKSGVALERIQSQEQQGSYHFIDNYDRYLMHVWRMLDDLITPTYDTARDVGTRGADDQHALKRINEPYQDPETGEQMHLTTAAGSHDVSITTGPSMDSQREAATTFAANLATPELIAAAIQGNPKASKIAAYSIKLQNGGALMDSMAEVLDPQEQNAPEQAQQQIQQLMQVAQQMQAKIAELQPLADKNQTELEIAKLRAGVDLQKDQADNTSKIAVALIAAKAKVTDTAIAEAHQNARTLFEHHAQAIHDAHGMTHEGEMADAQRAHEQDMAAGEQAHQANLQDQAAQQAAEQANQEQSNA